MIWNIVEPIFCAFRAHFRYQVHAFVHFIVVHWFFPNLSLSYILWLISTWINVMLYKSFLIHIYLVFVSWKNGNISGKIMEKSGNLISEFGWKPWQFLGSAKNCESSNQSINFMWIRTTCTNNILLLICLLWLLSWYYLPAFGPNLIIIINYFFQYDCTNTLNDQILENVTVQMDTADGFEVIKYIPCPSLPYDKPGTTYTICALPDDPTAG